MGGKDSMTIVGLGDTFNNVQTWQDSGDSNKISDISNNIRTGYTVRKKYTINFCAVFVLIEFWPNYLIFRRSFLTSNVYLDHISVNIHPTNYLKTGYA